MRPFPVAAYALTFLTGSAGLVYQVVWQRYLARMLGSDSLATATVLGVFLGGLSLGYWVCGRLSQQSRRPFVVYGLLEIGIGLWAATFPLLFSWLERATDAWSFAPTWPLTLQGSLCALLLIGPPTVCMGGTLPLLTRGLTAYSEQATRVHASIYAVNTAGAALGTLAAAFVWIERYGLPATLRGAALLSAGAGLWFLVAGRNRTIDRSGRRPGVERHAGAWGYHAIAAASGFYFMVVETALIRVAGLSLGSSSYSFAVIVSVLIVSTAVGAAIVARIGHPGPRALLRNQIAICVGLAALFMMLDKGPYVAHLLRISFSTSPSAFALYWITIVVTAMVVLALPGAFLGATLPLTFDALRGADTQLDRLGLRVGGLFAWNALGSLAGAILGGYVAYRWIGIGETILLALAVAAGSVWLAARRTPGRATGLAAVVIVVTTLFIAAYPAHDPLRFASGTFRIREPLTFSYDGAAEFYERFYENRDVLAYTDDPSGTFAVIENPSPVEALRRSFPDLAPSLLGDPAWKNASTRRPRSILVNGKPDSSTYYDRETLRLLAHLPALFAAERGRILVIGLGTGVTAGELTLYPDVERLRVVEISRAVIDFLPLFDEFTRGLRDDPRLRLEHGDGFRTLRRCDERWDLILSQPSNPWTVGIDALFSREFYRQAKRRLSADGILVQWVQRYATDDRQIALAVNTLLGEFPHVRVFRGDEHDDLLLASRKPLDGEREMQIGIELARNPRVVESLREIGIGSQSDLLARERPEILEIARELRDEGIETLDHPRLHYIAGRSFFRGSEAGDEP